MAAARAPRALEQVQCGGEHFSVKGWATAWHSGFHLVHLLWFPSWAMAAYFRVCPMEAFSRWGSSVVSSLWASEQLSPDHRHPGFLKGAYA